ncbi:DUF1700 domain-containing protein [Sphingomonas abietis]|uniref:DUF1700 domain-containing protein n=1 Tax=Sphingomonas abietis TaxID=3012344 RepID=A0ABY7NLY2_9SPHN|nr:hypothetical protein [Sphingomonas abietis]WBO21481.1 hypothetical protein PBT88_15005 [Sphingomonas abietis]
MRDAETRDHEIDAYVRKLLWALQSIGLEDRLAISSEIHSHLTDCNMSGIDTLTAAIARLGPPHRLARRYVEEYELAGAVSRAGPAQLLLNMIHRASRSLTALGAAFATLILYLFAAAFGVIAVAKPIVPNNVGAWHSADGWEAGLVASPPADSSDVLGLWIIPIAVALALATYLIGTRLLRTVAGKLLSTPIEPASS